MKVLFHVNIDKKNTTENCTVLYTLVVKCLWSIPLVVSDSGSVRTVHWQLKVVGSQSVKMSVVVRKQTALKGIKYCEFGSVSVHQIASRADMKS